MHLAAQSTHSGVVKRRPTAPRECACDGHKAMTEKHIERDHLRSTEKCFVALEMLNAAGPMRISELGKRLGVPRTTTVRILKTLAERGYIARDKQKRYAVSIGVNRLSYGYRPSESVLPRIERLMVAFAERFVWPVTFALPGPDAMYSRVATDELTPFKMFANPPGTRLPYFGTACGTVFLAFCTDAERDTIDKLESLNPSDSDLEGQEIDAIISKAKKRKYCFMNQWKIGTPKDRELYSKDGAVAIPLLVHDHAFGALATRFIDSAVRMSEVESEIVPQMRELAGSIEQEWKAYIEGQPLHPV